jgi:hypothetical protein
MAAGWHALPLQRLPVIPLDHAPQTFVEDRVLRFLAEKAMSWPPGFPSVLAHPAHLMIAMILSVDDVLGERAQLKGHRAAAQTTYRDGWEKALSSLFP